MSWNTLDPTIKAIAQQALTRRQLDVWKLHLAGLGQRRIADMLQITRSTVRSHLHDAHQTLARNGVHRDRTGRYYRKEAA